MTASNVAATQRVAYAFLDAHFAWLPKPTIVESTDPNEARDHATATAISVPKYSDAWNDGRPDVVIHECGHVLAFWLGERRVPIIETFLDAFGADPRTTANPLINEIFAEHFARAYVDGYAGANYPALVGLVRFDAETMRAFCEGLRPPATTAAPPPVVVQPAPNHSDSVTPQSAPRVFDVRDELPRTDWEIGRFGPKTSRTYHWNGPALPTDVAPLELILGDAHFHVSKDWSPEPGIQGGDGIMYHRLVAPNGDLYLTRDLDAVLWACGSALGNAHSEHVQVMCGAYFDDAGKIIGTQPPTAAQFATMRWLERTLPLGETFPHDIWSETKCPGPDITDWVSARAWESEEEMFSRETFNAWFREQQLAEITPTIVDMKDVETKTVEMVRKIEAGETVEQAERDALTASVAAVQARLDKLHQV